MSSHASLIIEVRPYQKTNISKRMTDNNTRRIKQSHYPSSSPNTVSKKPDYRSPNTLILPPFCLVRLSGVLARHYNPLRLTWCLLKGEHLTAIPRHEIRDSTPNQDISSPLS